jgi:hypothetical protein
MYINIKTNMNRDQAAIVIQNAWRMFDDERKSRMMDEYNKGLTDTYYRECCTLMQWEYEYEYEYEYQ